MNSHARHCNTGGCVCVRVFCQISRSLGYFGWSPGRSEPHSPWRHNSKYIQGWVGSRKYENGNSELGPWCCGLAVCRGLFRMIVCVCACVCSFLFVSDHEFCRESSVQPSLATHFVLFACWYISFDGVRPQNASNSHKLLLVLLCHGVNIGAGCQNRHLHDRCLCLSLNHFRR